MKIEDKQNKCEDRRYEQKKIEDNNVWKSEDVIQPSVAANKISMKMEPSIAAKLGNLVQSKISASGGIIKYSIAGGTYKKSRGPFKKKGKGGRAIKKLNLIHVDQTRTDQPNSNETILDFFKPVPIVLSPEEDLINRN